VQGLCEIAGIQYLFGKYDKEPCAMNAFADLSMKSDEVLHVELEEFRRQH
jgi:hypothetical protein